ncbi:YdcH family protein, partial [Escherichia coli]
MFPEYRDLISRLKNENPRFMSLFDKHNKLDHEIARKEGSDGRGYNAEVVRMKKQKLQLKDEMLKILQQESVKEVQTFLSRQPGGFFNNC